MRYGQVKESKWLGPEDLRPKDMYPYQVFEDTLPCSVDVYLDCCEKQHNPDNLPHCPFPELLREVQAPGTVVANEGLVPDSARFFEVHARQFDMFASDDETALLVVWE